jgi:hypothetical protein
MKPATHNQFVASNARNMTTDELISYCENTSDDPIVLELADRLKLYRDFADELIQEELY